MRFLLFQDRGLTVCVSGGGDLKPCFFAPRFKPSAARFVRRCAWLTDTKPTNNPRHYYHNYGLVLRDRTQPTRAFQDSVPSIYDECVKNYEAKLEIFLTFWQASYACDETPNYGLNSTMLFNNWSIQRRDNPAPLHRHMGIDHCRFYILVSQ